MNFGDEGRTTRFKQLRGFPDYYSWLNGSRGDLIVDEIIGDIFDKETTDLDIYVNAVSGDDDSGDGSSGNPYKSLQRAFDDVPLYPVYRRTIHIVEGTCTIDKEILYNYYVDRVYIIGDYETENSYTISNVVAYTDDDGIQLQVSGAGWTPGELVGRHIKWTSGTFKNRWGVIYDNTADTISVTHNSGKGKMSLLLIDGYHFSVGDKFNLIQFNAGVKFDKVGAPQEIHGTAYSRFTWRYLNITSDIISSTQHAANWFEYCNVKMEYFAGANASFMIHQCCYVESSGSLCAVNNQNTAWKIFGGSVFNGKGNNGIFMRDNGVLKIQGEVVFMNFNETGVSIVGSFINGERINDALVRWKDCAAGVRHGWWNEDLPSVVFQSDASSLCNLPTMVGNITGDWLVKARGGDKINLFPETNVTTALGTNTCTCNGTSESYFNDADGTTIYGLDKFGETIRQDINTTAQTIYVDITNGDDDTGNGTTTYPYKTIRKAYKAIPLNSQVKYTIDCANGTYSLPNDLTILSQNDGIIIQGKKSIEETGLVVTGIGTSSRANGITLTVAGTPWSVNEHKGKIIKITSGASNNNYGIVKSNTANTILITTDDIDYSVAIPIIGDTFDIYKQDVELEIPSTNTSVMNSVILINDCKVTGDYLFATQMSTLWFNRCYCKFKKINLGHSSVYRLNRTYFESSTTPNYMVESSEQCTFLMEMGSVIDGGGTLGMSLNNNTNFRIKGEVVLQNLSSDGVTIRYSNITSDNDTSTLRLENCAAGFVDRTNSSGGGCYVKLPYLRGVITGDYLVSGNSGSKYIFDDVSVTTALGTNVCSANMGDNECYEAEDGTKIYGLEKDGKYDRYIQTTDATVTDIATIDVEEGDVFEVQVKVLGRKSDGTDRALYNLEGLFYRNTAGNVTQEGAISSITTIESDINWNCNLVADTVNQTIDIQVTGVAATTINWKAMVKYIKLN